MDSLKKLFVIGPGPSSSHTIGPFNAAKDFKNKLENYKYNKIIVILFGSLALTGKGHLTDEIIKKVLGNDIEIVFDTKTKDLPHPNTMIFSAYIDNKLVFTEEYISIGGGAIINLTNEKNDNLEVYPFHTFEEMNKYLIKHNFNSYTEIVDELESDDIEAYLNSIVDHMFDGIEDGLKENDRLPGKLNLERVAGKIYQDALNENDPTIKKQLLLTSFAYATSENNASGRIIVTAPTCGSAGIIPSLLYYSYKYQNFSKKEIINALKIAGLIGNIVKYSASISGAVGGCQAEIGTATAMGAGALSYLYGLSNGQIEYAAEVAMEHSLGLTCDPVEGYVQIPCIERNGIYCLKAYVAFIYAKYIAHSRKNRISFDQVVEAMKITGDDLLSSYKETSLGGLAKVHK